MRSKIEQSLTPAKLQEFCSKAAQLKGGLLKDIQALAGDYGIEVSLMGARTFRGGRFQEYLRELSEKREMAENVSEAARHGLGLADAAAVALSQKIFDDMVSGEELTLAQKDKYALALSRLRTGDHRSRLLEAKLDEMANDLEMQQFSAAAMVIKHAAVLKVIVNDKGLNDRARTDRVRQILFGFQPENFSPVTATGDDRS
jgi:hypothetical protein